MSRSRRSHHSFKKDVELTKLRHEMGIYSHPDSQVHINGKEYLFGEDKRERRRQVWERDQRRCVRCGVYVDFEQMEMDHIAKNVGEPRWDNIENLRILCVPCHRGPKGKHA